MDEYWYTKKMSQITYCVIGAGRWGKNHIRTANECGVLTAVVDPNQAALNEIKEQYPNVQVFSSLDEPGALNFDAYTVAVPAEHHYTIAKQLIESDKHVLIEKPITIDSNDAVELVELAKHHQVVACVGHLLLFHNLLLRHPD